MTNCDFITIFANKKGYLVGQRTFVKDSKDELKESSKSKTSKKSSNTSQEDGKNRITIVLIKEALIVEEKSVIMFTYSNLPGDNFSAIVLNDDKSKILFLTL